MTKNKQEGKPTEKPWIKDYQGHEWKTYEIPVTDQGEIDQLQNSSEPVSDHDLYVCAAESEAAQQRWETSRSTTNVLYHDYEQELVLGFDQTYGVGEVRKLTQDWKTHKKGALVMVVYRGVDKNPPFFTYCIEDIKQ